MLRQFRTDRNYLAKYHERSCLVLFVICVGLAFLRAPVLQTGLWYLPCLYLLSSPRVTMVLSGFAYAVVVGIFSPGFHALQLLWIPVAMLVTFPVTALLHCASHDSLRPRILNRVVGELLSLVQLYGFPDWKVLHFIHHTHTDNPELDPHPPLDKKYWDFAVEVRDVAAAAFLKNYFQHFGQNPESVASALRYSRSAKTATVVKLVFWFLVLGPQAFAFLYTTSIAFKMLHYAWLNHATHRPSPDGAEIQNLNHGWFYPVINALAFGLYFHKNHHLAPSAFNPQRWDETRNRPAA